MEPLGTRLLETERIVLRKICLNDYKEMYDNWASIDECSNLASGKVLQKCGMKKVGSVPEKYYIRYSLWRMEGYAV